MRIRDWDLAGRERDVVRTWFRNRVNSLVICTARWGIVFLKMYLLIIKAIWGLAMFGVMASRTGVVIKKNFNLNSTSR